MVRWKHVWLHESYCVKFPNLVNEYWLENGNNPDVVLLKDSTGTNDGEHILETVFNENLEALRGQILEDQTQSTIDTSTVVQKEGKQTTIVETATVNPEQQEIQPDEHKIESSDTPLLPTEGINCAEANSMIENVEVSHEQSNESLETDKGQLVNSNEGDLQENNHREESLLVARNAVDPSSNFDVTHLEASNASNVTAVAMNDTQTQSMNSESQAVSKPKNIDAKGKRYVPTRCDICKKMLSSRNSLREHQITIHWKNGRFPCADCDKRFTNRRSLQIHRVMHTKERNYVCELCGSTHKRPHELTLHMRDMHSENQTYRCDVCFQCFKTKSDLKAHCFGDHVDTVTDCIVCKQKLMTPFSIYTHCLKHAGYRDFDCDVCGRAFKTKKALTDHQKTHNQNRKPYKECPKCGKAIYSRSHYYEHVNSHAGDSHEIVRFPCTMCESTFQHTSSLKRHLLRHRAGGDLEHPKDNPYLSMDESALPSLCCRKCRRNYTSKSGYYDHIKRCRDGIVNRFPCARCPKEYTKRSALNRHARKHHPEIFVAEYFDEQTTVEIVNSDQIETIETDENEVLVHVQVALAPEITDAEITEHYIEENAEAIQSIEVQTMPES